MFILFMLLTYKSYAGFIELEKDALYNYQIEPPQVIKRTSSSIKKKKSDNLLLKLLEEDRKISDLLEKQQKNLIIKREKPKISSLARIKGTLLNSILAMNVAPATLVIRLGNDSEDLEGGEIRCKSLSFQRRVIGKCDLLVIDNKEFEINAEIWDIDGAQGLIPDYHYLGEEKTFLTSSLSSFFSSMLQGAKTNVMTPFGEMTSSTQKNQILNGIMGIADNVNQKIKDSGEKSIEISYVNSGKELLVFFNKSLNMTKESK